MQNSMQNTSPNRKRPAPGASPMMQQPIPQNPFPYTQPQMQDNTTDFSNFDFTNPFPTDQTYPDPSAFDNNNFSYNLNTAQSPTYTSNANAPTSQELVRRTRNQQLAPQNGQQELWNGYNNAGGDEYDENEAELERKVAAAKKDAQGKRKQIPPFVQKLSSFLDSNNTDLIRWSDDGKSFIVLDEDEFARTLIPELFKHNNYASFVRQLNMYGFHKTVNITDGSLRQSEKARKGVKPPSMYSHPYFRKNRPDLLWLIQKPTGKTPATTTATKRKRDGNNGYDSDDGREFSPQPDGRPQEIAMPGSNHELTQLPRTEMAQVRSDLQKLQNQQRFISQMITQLKEQNDQFYRQATAFQALHDRHENSINAILTFLATFYNRSLEGHGAQNLVNMFTNAQNQQQRGSVVEEYNDGTPAPSNNQLQRFIKRTPLLLPGPNSNMQQEGSASTQPNSARASVSPPTDQPNNNNNNSSSTARESSAARTDSPAVKTEPPTPQLPENSDDMMNLINSVNATTQASSTPNTAAPALDFNTLVDQYSNLNGNNPLTPQQRDNTLASIMRQTANSGNALTAGSGSGIGNFDMNQLKNSRETMETLQNMQKRTADQIQNLSERLTPLSPSGNIPGLSNVNQDPFDSLGAPGEYDPNAFLNFDENSWDPNATGNADFDFGFDTSGGGNWDGNWGAGAVDGTSGINDGSFGVDDGGGEEGNMFNVDSKPNDNGFLAPNPQSQSQGQDVGGGKVESVSSGATSPAGTVEEPGTPSKRQRRL